MTKNQKAIKSDSGEDFDDETDDQFTAAVGAEIMFHS